MALIDWLHRLKDEPWDLLLFSAYLTFGVSNVCSHTDIVWVALYLLCRNIQTGSTGYQCKIYGYGEVFHYPGESFILSIDYTELEP